MKTIDDLLQDVGEDKHENLSTTSFKFKRDLWDFCTDPAKSFNKKTALEFGTHKGQTTRILAHLFNKVHTVNLPNHFDYAMMLNADLDNINYIGFNLYQNSNKLPVKEVISLAFIDAVHTFDAVMSDFTKLLELKYDERECYVVFDDYGTYNDVYAAVEQLIKTGYLQKVQYIGHPPKYSFGGNPERILQNPEGVICKLKYDLL